MKSATLEAPSPFGAASLALDKQLDRFNKYTSQLKSLDLETDKGFEKAVGLLTEIEKTREGLQADMLLFSEALKKAKIENDSNEAAIAALLPTIVSRQKNTGTFLERFKLLGSMVAKLNESIGHFKDRAKQGLSDIERQELGSELQEIDAKLEILANETTQMVEDARKANMKAMELEADSLRKSLSASRNKLKLLYSKH